MKKLNISTEALQPYIDKIEKLPKAQRLLICFGTVFVILGVFAWFTAWPKYDRYRELKAEIETMEEKLAAMKIEAAKLPRYREKWENTKAQFALVKKKLPEEKEIPDLLTSISQSGQEVGLEFLLFQPKGETRKDFFAEIPVAIEVKGGYHNLGQFLAKVASLPRVVNIKDLKLVPRGDSAILKTTCTAVTYRFVDKPAGKKGGKKNKKKKKKR